MNKELTKKYKAEFDAWVEGKSLLYKTTTSDVWVQANNRDISGLFSNPSHYIKAIIIDDSYVIYRKALAEGKTVQFHYINPTIGLDEWQTINDVNPLTFSHSIDLYRIKPEEPQFKVGDWVKHKDNGRCVQVSENSKITLTHFEPWKPKPKDWCWSTVFGLVKVLGETIEAGKPCYLCWNPWQRVEQKLNNLEPFIGTLPTFLQE